MRQSNGQLSLRMIHVDETIEWPIVPPNDSRSEIGDSRYPGEAVIFRGKRDENLVECGLRQGIVIDRDQLLKLADHLKCLGDSRNRACDSKEKRGAMNGFQLGKGEMILDELSRLLHLIGVCQLHRQRVSTTEFLFQMLKRSDTMQLTGDHNGQSRAQNFAFFHAMRCDQHRSILSTQLSDQFPHELLTRRIHPR